VNMNKTRFSMLYLGSYLVLIGPGLLFAPDSTLEVAARELPLGATKENSLMRHITHIAIEHIAVSLRRSYDQVKATLEARMGSLGSTGELVRQMAGLQASWEQITQAIDKRLGRSGFTIFSRVEQGQLLCLAGKPRRVVQYAVGNQLLAIQMIERVPEVALYAPLRLAIYEGKKGRLTSPMIAFPRCFPGITGRRSLRSRD